jgi:hypothetical protein
MANEYALALDDTTVHKTVGSGPDKDLQGREVWSVESVVLSPGDYVKLSDLPDYLADAVKAGDVPTLKAVSEGEAKDTNAKAKAARASGAPSALAVEVRETQHSDYLVPDEERAENHRALAEAEGAPAPKESDSKAPSKASADEGDK